MGYSYRNNKLTGAIELDGTIAGRDIAADGAALDQVVADVAAIDPVLATLEKSFVANEQHTLTLASGVVSPSVAVTKEVPQIGITSNRLSMAIRENIFTYQNFGPATSITPSALSGGGTFTLGTGSFDAADVGRAYHLNGGIAVLTKTDGTYYTVKPFTTLATAQAGDWVAVPLFVDSGALQPSWKDTGNFNLDVASQLGTNRWNNLWFKSPSAKGKLSDTDIVVAGGTTAYHLRASDYMNPNTLSQIGSTSTSFGGDDWGNGSSKLVGYFTMNGTVYGVSYSNPNTYFWEMTFNNTTNIVTKTLVHSANLGSYLQSAPFWLHVIDNDKLFSMGRWSCKFVMSTPGDLTTISLSQFYDSGDNGLSYAFSADGLTCYKLYSIYPSPTQVTSATVTTPFNMAEISGLSFTGAVSITGMVSHLTGASCMLSGSEVVHLYDGAIAYTMSTPYDWKTLVADPNRTATESVKQNARFGAGSSNFYGWWYDKPNDVLWHLGSNGGVKLGFVSGQSTYPTAVTLPYVIPVATRTVFVKNKVFLFGQSGQFGICSIDTADPFNETLWTCLYAGYVNHFNTGATATNPDHSGGITSDGTKAWFRAPNGTTMLWDLTTPYDMSTRTNYKTFTDGLDTFYSGNVYISDDGLVMLTASLGYVRCYDLPTPYDIANKVQRASVDFTTQFSMVASGHDLMFVSDDGKRMMLTRREDYAYGFAIAAVAAKVNEKATAVTNVSGRFDTNYWTDVNAITASQTVVSGEVYHSVSTDDRNTFFVMDANGLVRNIARNNAGTWEVNTNATYAAETWVAAATNDMHAAITEATDTAANQMVDYTALADAELFTVSATLDFAITMSTTDTQQRSTLTALTVDYDANVLNEAATLGVDYRYDQPANDKIRIESLKTQNLKVRVV